MLVIRALRASTTLFNSRVSKLSDGHSLSSSQQSLVLLVVVVMVVVLFPTKVMQRYIVVLPAIVRHLVLAATFRAVEISPQRLLKQEEERGET